MKIFVTQTSNYYYEEEYDLSVKKVFKLVTNALKNHNSIIIEKNQKTDEKSYDYWITIRDDYVE